MSTTGVAGWDVGYARDVTQRRYSPAACLAVLAAHRWEDETYEDASPRRLRPESH